MARRPSQTRERVVVSLSQTAPPQVVSRYRAGLGPFFRTPITIEVEGWQADALRSDPMLAVSPATEVE